MWHTKTKQVSISWQLPEEVPVGPQGSWSFSAPSRWTCAPSRRWWEFSSGTWFWKPGPFSQSESRGTYKGLKMHLFITFQITHPHPHNTHTHKFCTSTHSCFFNHLPILGTRNIYNWAKRTRRRIEMKPLRDVWRRSWTRNNMEACDSYLVLNLAADRQTTEIRAKEWRGQILELCR